MEFVPSYLRLFLVCISGNCPELFSEIFFRNVFAEFFSGMPFRNLSRVVFRILFLICLSGILL